LTLGLRDINFLDIYHQVNNTLE